MFLQFVTNAGLLRIDMRKNILSLIEKRELLYPIALFCNASVRPVRPFWLNSWTLQNGSKCCSIHRASVLINYAKQKVGAKSGTACTAPCRFITNVGLLRFGSFWAQNVCNIALLIYKYILVWCTAWYSRYGDREPKNQIPICFKFRI